MYMQHTHTHIHMYIHTYTHIRTPAHTHTHTHTHIHTHTPPWSGNATVGGKALVLVYKNKITCVFTFIGICV